MHEGYFSESIIGFTSTPASVTTVSGQMLPCAQYEEPAWWSLVQNVKLTSCVRHVGAGLKLQVRSSSVIRDRFHSMTSTAVCQIANCLPGRSFVMGQ
eukprot:6191903-Pleurochrysis_carterae.AAC.1